MVFKSGLDQPIGSKGLALGLAFQGASRFEGKREEQKKEGEEEEQVAQGQYVVSDTRCPAVHDCEFE